MKSVEERCCCALEDSTSALRLARAARRFASARLLCSSVIAIVRVLELRLRRGDLRDLKLKRMREEWEREKVLADLKRRDGHMSVVFYTKRRVVLEELHDTRLYLFTSF